MKHALSHKGFTFIELILYVSISAVMLLAILAFLSSLLQSRIKNQTIAEVEQQGLQAMHMITQAVRNASAIGTPAQGASAAVLSVGTIAAGNDPTVFDLAGGVIRMKEGAGDAVPLTNSRIIGSALAFQNLSRASTPGTVRIQFTLAHRNPEGRNEYNFSRVFIGSATLRQP